MYSSIKAIKKVEKPVLTYKDVPYKAALIFNAGVAKINDKANASDVYTKTETDSAIKSAITAYDTANMQLLGEDN